jgi:hypothetical protein
MALIIIGSESIRTELFTGTSGATPWKVIVVSVAPHAFARKAAGPILFAQPNCVEVENESAWHRQR